MYHLHLLNMVMHLEHLIYGVRKGCLRVRFVPYPVESTLSQITGVSFTKAASFCIA